MNVDKLIFLSLILALVTTVICFSIGSYILTRIKIMDSKKIVQCILDSENLSDFEKGTLLLEECNKAHYCRSEKYKNEVYNLTIDFWNNHNLKLSDLLRDKSSKITE